MLYGQTNVPTEFGLTAAQSYSDTFNEVEVDVAFTGPDGQEWRVPAFWAGDSSFRVRFAAPTPGRYAYRSICTNPDDNGLHGQTGELEVIPYPGNRHLYQHGRLRVAETKRTLEHVDGTPFFWLGDSWWMGLVKSLDWPHGFRALVADRVAKEFNLIQIVAGPLAEYHAETEVWHPGQANEAGWPWEGVGPRPSGRSRASSVPRSARESAPVASQATGKDWARINPAFYDLADLRIAYLVESGLVPCITAMWGYYLSFMGVEKAKQHWRNLVARYGAYPVVWCMAGEVTMPTYSYHGDEENTPVIAASQWQGWSEVTRYVRQIDPYHNPITAHARVPGDARFPRDVTLLDIDMLGTGHSGYGSLKPTVEMVKSAVAEQPPMPVINGEVCYEGIMGGSLEDVQRFLFWTCATSGCAGHTYGAQGIWQMNSPEEPFDGAPGHWGAGFWRDAMHRPGSAQVGIGRRFFERYPWWLFEPRKEPRLPQASASAFAIGIPKAVAIYYLPADCIEDLALRGVQTGGLFMLRRLSVTIEPGANYQGSYFNPRTGDEVPVGPVTPDADGVWTRSAPLKPTMEDWVLVLEDREALARIRQTQ